MVVACHSGRGRSGTLAAIIGGLLHDVGTVAEAVDQIVRMRCVIWFGLVCWCWCWGSMEGGRMRK